MPISAAIMIFVELLIITALAGAWGYRKFRKLKDQLEYVQGKLDDGPSDEFINDKIRGYLEQQLKQSELKRGPEDQENNLLAQEQVELVDVRLKLLDSEIRTFNSHQDPSKETYWQDIFDRYQSVVPEPKIVTKIETITETIEVEVPVEVAGEDLFDSIEDESAHVEMDAFTNSEGGEVDVQAPTGGLELGDSIFDTATDELNRLRDVVGKQYDSIDELKSKIRNIEDGDDSDIDKDDPVLAEMSRRLSQLESETDQMSMCVKVLEDENLRLREVIESMGTDPNGESGSEKLEKLDAGAESVSKVAKDLQMAESLVRSLVNSNKDLLKRIAELEIELDAAQTAEVAYGDINEVLEVDPNELLEQAQALIANLAQTNKEHLQCLSILESEADDLRGRMDEKNATIEMYQKQIGDSEGSNKTGKEESEAPRFVNELNIKMAELELLQSDYDSMKAKYFALVSESKAS